MVLLLYVIGMVDLLLSVSLSVVVEDDDDDEYKSDAAVLKLEEFRSKNGVDESNVAIRICFENKYQCLFRNRFYSFFLQT